MDAAFERYRFARDQKIGRGIPCAYCGETFRKKTQAHAFCSNNGAGNCKDAFWQMKDEYGVTMRTVARRVNIKKASREPNEQNEVAQYVHGMLQYATGPQLSKIARILGYYDSNEE